MGAKARVKAKSTARSDNEMLNKEMLTKLETEHREPVNVPGAGAFDVPKSGEIELDESFDFDATHDRIVEEEVPGVFHNERLDRIVAAMAGAIRSDAAGYVGKRCPGSFSQP
jgi:hypothetical protein